MFESKSETLYDFFNNAGVAYYIPYYQRQYSWDSENVEKMLDDLSDGVKKICIKNDYLRFIGSIILWAEESPIVGTHYDSNGLITKIYNVIDGQQRISTIAILAMIMSEKLEEIKKSIDKKNSSLPVFSDVANSIFNRQQELEEFFSTSVKKANVNPAKKPIIIRAYDSSSSPSVDQWTLKGNEKDYYKSDVANIIAEFIKNGTVNPRNITNSKLKKNILIIKRWIDEIEKDLLQCLPSTQILLQQKDTSLNNINFEEINDLSPNDNDLASGTIRVLSLVSFLFEKTYLTSIECPTENLAFDMFQSINATGTPLTAIEVFKPLVVNNLGGNFGNSQTKEFFKLIDNFFDEQKTASGKEKLTDDVLARMALVYDGEELGKRFSGQRDWLIKSYNNCSTQQDKEDLIHWLYDVTEYFKQVLKPTLPSSKNKAFPLSSHFVTLGLNMNDADLTALCIFYLKKTQHTMAHYLISLFYSKLLRAQKTSNLQNSANEFRDVCKACAAFFTLWSSSLTGFPDQVYRDLFSQTKANISHLSGKNNQTSSFVKNHFRQALEYKEIFDVQCPNTAKNLWMTKAKFRLGYNMNKTVCRFALFVTAHDKAPDTTNNHEGLMILGKSGAAQYLNCAAWFSLDYAEIEHIANKAEPKAPKYPLDPLLYSGNASAIHSIGNLTLLSKSVNAGMYVEWADKVFYYSTLTFLAPTQPANLQFLAKAQGISNIPPTLINAAAGTNYIANLAPLALRGSAGLPWDKVFVDKRTERICDLLFDDMTTWL